MIKKHQFMEENLDVSDSVVRIGVIIPARNEEESIGETLGSLFKQTLLPQKIIVVDDGSTDSTAEVAKKHGVQVVSLPDRGFDAQGKPSLAAVINTGLEESQDMDYVCILGAEQRLPTEYFEEIIRRMEEDADLKISSGMISGERFVSDFPWGSGRMIKASFFRKIGFTFPVEYGWEDWIVYKAKMMGFKTECYGDIVSSTKRPMSMKNKGEIMYALGYDWKYALGRIVYVSLKNPRTGLNMLKGWLFHRRVRRLDDVSDWVNQYQKKSFWKNVRKQLKIWFSRK